MRPNLAERYREVRRQAAALDGVTKLRFNRQPWRAGVPPGADEGRPATKRVLVVLMWLVGAFLAMLIGSGATHLHDAEGNLGPLEQTRAVAAMCFATVLVALSAGLIGEGQLGWRDPLRTAFGSSLPVRWETRAWRQAARFWRGGALAFAAVFMAGPDHPSWVDAAATALLLTLALTTGPWVFGKVTVLVAVSVLSPDRARRVLQLLNQVVSFVAVGALAAALAKAYPQLDLLVPTRLFRPIAGAVVAGTFSLGAVLSVGPWLLGLIAACAAYVALSGSAVDPPIEFLDMPPTRPPPPLRSLWQFQARFLRRLPGGAGLIGMVVLAFALTDAAKMFAHTRKVPTEIMFSVPLYFVLLFNLPVSWLNGAVMQGASKDLKARPFLGSLPLALERVLSGRARLLALGCALLLATLALALALPPHPSSLGHVGLALVRLTIGFAILADIKVSIQAMAPDSGMDSRLIPNLFFAAVATFMLPGLIAPEWWGGLMPMLACAALALPLRRAAIATLSQWGDAPELPTIVRAFIVYSIFAGATGVAFGVLLPLGVRWALPLGYLFVAGPGLLLLLKILHAPRDSFTWRASRSAFPLLGVLGGLGLGAVALGLNRALGLESFQQDVGSWGMASQVLLLLATVVAAPLAEELFFRAYLIPVIARELGTARADWAIVLSAVAFSALHPPAALVGTLGIGLLAGYLYMRGGGLASAILTHAAYNAVVVGSAIAGV